MLILAVKTQAVEAQQIDPGEVGTLVHYAYAPLLGTGWYRIGDQSAFVFSVPAEYRFGKLAGDKLGIYLNFPVAVGLYNFEFDDLLDTSTEDIATASFLPGVEMQYMVRENWILKPFANFGWGTDFNDNNSAWIYAAGLKSLADYHWEKVTLSLGVEYLWSGYNPEKGRKDYINRFGLGLRARYPLKWQFGDRDTSLIVHGITYYYANKLQFSSTRSLSESFDVRKEYEFGISLGSDPGIRILGIKFDQIGIGYRFGDKLSAVMLIGSFPF